MLHAWLSDFDETQRIYRFACALADGLGAYAYQEILTREQLVEYERLLWAHRN